jgi:plastocyanin
MNNKIVTGIVLIVLVIGGLVLFGNNKSGKNTPPVQTKPEVTQTTQTTNSITISNFSFNPNALTVKVGTTVTWTNQDSVVHKIKSDNFNSPDLGQGDKFEFTFSNKGSFDYVCSIHPSMQGKIIVE